MNGPPLQSGFVRSLIFALLVLPGMNTAAESGFANTIEYGNFTVSMGIFDLSMAPDEIVDALKEVGLERRVALVMVTPTSWATDSADDHAWAIIDIDGIRYDSIDPFIESASVEVVVALDEYTRQFIYRSRPRHMFAPNKPNPLLAFFSADLPPVESWQRVIFLDFLNGFEVEMHRIESDEPDFEGPLRV